MDFRQSDDKSYLQRVNLRHVGIENWRVTTSGKTRMPNHRVFPQNPVSKGPPAFGWVVWRGSAPP